GTLENNAPLFFSRMVLFPLLRHRNSGAFLVARKEEHGGPVGFATYEELEEAFLAGKIHPADLKGSLAREMNELLKPVREVFSTEEGQRIIAEAYP
ncbi:MAG: tyrosyl-tRNA synthetase, partial [Amphiamblys sp. WSBS2006]